MPDGIVLPDGSQRPYLLRADNTTDALFWESPDYTGPGNADPEKHLVGPKPEWVASNVAEGKKEFRATLPLLALPLRLYHFDRRSVAECWRRVAMYRDISDALRHERSLLHEVRVRVRVRVRVSLRVRVRVRVRVRACSP